VRVSISPFSIPIESVPLLDERLTVTAAAHQLSQTAGQPAIVLDRSTAPLGLLFPHRLLDPGIHPDCVLESLAATVLVVVPLIRSTMTWDLLQDCAPMVQQPTTRYAIAIGAEGQALGLIDLLTLPALAPMDHSLPMIVDRFAHEVASPLMGVLSLVTLLEDERFVTLPEPHHQHIQAIGHSADRMAYELERLDLASRIHQGKLMLYPESTTLASLCWRAITQAQNRCQPPRDGDVALSQAGRMLPSGAIDTVALWIDQRHGLHLLAAAIECVLGRYGSWTNLWLASTVIHGDLVVSLWSDADTSVVLDTRTSQSVQATIPPDRLETLYFLRTLVDFCGGDVSLKPSSDHGFHLDLLLPSVVISDGGAIELDTETLIGEITSAGITNTTSPLAVPSRTTHTPQKRGVASKRALVFTQRLSGDELALLEQPGWYVAIARSIRELSEKIAHLSPQLVLLDCETHELYRHLMPEVARHWKGQAIATLRERPTTAPFSPLGSNIQPIPDTFTLRYPLQAVEVSSCFQWASVINSTLIVLDLRDHRGATARSPEQTIPLVDQLRRHHYRTIAVNDLDQAQLFAEIWQPQVIVLHFPDDANLESWPQMIEDFADRVNIPCLVIQFRGGCGQASRRDRSIVYWPTTSEPETDDQSNVIRALQWLQYHPTVIDILSGLKPR